MFPMWWVWHEWAWQECYVVSHNLRMMTSDLTNSMLASFILLILSLSLFYSLLSFYLKATSRPGNPMASKLARYTDRPIATLDTHTHTNIHHHVTTVNLTAHVLKLKLIMNAIKCTCIGSNPNTVSDRS